MAYPLPPETQSYTLIETLYNWFMTMMITIIAYGSGYLKGRGKKRRIPLKVEGFLRERLTDLEG